MNLLNNGDRNLITETHNKHNSRRHTHLADMVTVHKQTYCTVFCVHMAFDRLRLR